MDIVNDTRACSNVLVAVSERCNAPKNCHEVFDRLSDAVLADAVELYTHCPAAPRRNVPATIDAGLSHLQAHSESASNPLLAVDSTLVECMPDLRSMSDTSWGLNAIYQLSMDWLDGLDVANDFAPVPSMSDSMYNNSTWYA